MKSFNIHGNIARRVLVNYRVAPSILQRHIPQPFRPKLINGFGVAGICLIRLEEMRPRFAPASIGFSSENAAHRIAVEWDDSEETKEGVCIPIRHSNSRLNTMVGGRFFPGKHEYTEFWTADSPNRIKIEVGNRGKKLIARVGGTLAKCLPQDSVFQTIGVASDFFRCGAVGWSPNRYGAGFEGLKLVADHWTIQPLAVEHCISNWFDDREAFPAGSIQFDSALLMKNIAHEWQALPPMRQPRKEAA